MWGCQSKPQTHPKQEETSVDAVMRNTSKGLEFFLIYFMLLSNFFWQVQRGHQKQYGVPEQTIVGLFIFSFLTLLMAWFGQQIHPKKYKKQVTNWNQQIGLGKRECKISHKGQFTDPIKYSHVVYLCQIRMRQILIELIQDISSISFFIMLLSLQHFEIQ